MKQLFVILVTIALVGCASNVDQAQESLSKSYSAMNAHLESGRPACTVMPSFEERLGCIGALYDQAAAAYAIPKATPQAIEPRYRVIGEQVDFGKITPNQAQVAIDQILSAELVGGHDRTIAAARQRDLATAQALQALGQQMQTQQRHNDMINAINRPHTMNCRTWGANTTCTGY